MVFQHILRMIRSGWTTIVITVLLAIAVSLIISLNTVPLYRSEATFIIAPNPNLPSSRDVVSALAALDTLKIFSTYGDVLTSQRVYDAALRALNLPDVDFSQYQRSTAMRPDSIILSLYVDGPDPALATTLANTIGQQGIEFINAYYDVFLINFLDQAQPSTQSFTPQTSRDALIASGIGLGIGLLLAFFRDLMRTPWVTFWEGTLRDKQSRAYKRNHFIRLMERDFFRQKGLISSLVLLELEGLRDLVDVLPEFAMNDILRQVTDILRNQLRGNDIIGRWEQRSFAVLLPSTAREPATRTAERLAAALSQPLKFGPAREESVKLQPSFGLASRTKGESVERMIELVEAALKKATSSSYEALPDEEK
jgi:diguanylate cyclase (GGDEF)-like protein